MLPKEKNYQFRKRLLNIHPKGIRDSHLVPSPSELEIKDGFILSLPQDAGDVILTAAKDFQDYLLTAMGVSARITYTATSEKNAMILSLAQEDGIDLQEAAGYAGFLANIDEPIRLYGQDERGIAQGLYHLEDIMTTRKAPFLERKTIKKRPLFTPRMIHSGYGLDHFPDQHLSAIAHAGMDAILLFAKGVDQTPYGYLDFNELIYRASKYGLDVYAYSYLESSKHPDDEDALKFYDNLYGSLFAQCPGLKGIVMVGESVEFPSKDPKTSGKSHRENRVDGIPIGKPSPGWWPCEDYPKWLNVVKNSVRKYKEDADVVFWTYNWGYAPEKDRLALIHSLPTDISLLVTYEMFEVYPLGNGTQICADYTLAFAGPGQYFMSEAQAAKERGIRLYTMSNTGGLTWDIGVIPYEPMPYQWMKRYKGLIEAKEKWNLQGLMESHHYGFWPSFISDLEKKAFTIPQEPMEKALTDVLTKHFGGTDIGAIDEALRLWSDAITHYTPTNEDQYGAFRIGPSYPFCLDAEMKPVSEPHAMFGNRIFYAKYTTDNTGRNSLSSIRLPEEIKSLHKMLQYIEDGVVILEGIENQNEALLYLINLGKFICCCVQTALNAKKWYLLTRKLALESDRATLRQLISDAEILLEEEATNVKRALPLVESDSRLGWEPSMEYMTDPKRIQWKLRQLDYVLNTELARYKKGVEL